MARCTECWTEINIVGVMNNQVKKANFLEPWINDTGETTIFHENGTTTSILGDLQGTGTWKLENDRLIITFGLILTFDYSFSNNDETLTLINVDTGLTFVNIKQK